MGPETLQNVSKDKEEFDKEEARDFINVNGDEEEFESEETDCGTEEAVMANGTEVATL